MKNIEKYIDHTLLSPAATSEDVKRLCLEAEEYGFYAVCVNSFFVPLCAEELKGTDVKIASVVGFPLGAALTEAKVCEAELACKEGASEIDMVMNIGAFKGGDFEAVSADIKAVAETVHGFKGELKVILETSLLDPSEIEKACVLASAAGADFVKTSTGFTGRGAALEDIAIMKKAVSPGVKIKASGGIRDRAAAEAMIEAGADRIGASSGVKIVGGVQAL